MPSIDNRFIDADAKLARDLDKGLEAQIDEHLDDYGRLPMSLKMSYTRTEYDWLSDAEKATLVERSCEPEA